MKRYISVDEISSVISLQRVHVISHEILDKPPVEGAASNLLNQKTKLASDSN